MKSAPKKLPRLSKARRPNPPKGTGSSEGMQIKDIIRHHDLPNHEPCRSLVDELRRSNLAAITQNLKLLSYFELGKSLYSSTKLSEVFEDVIIQIRLITKVRKAFIVLHQANKNHEQLVFTTNRQNRVREFRLSPEKAERFMALTEGQHPVIRSFENMKHIWDNLPQIADSESRDGILVLVCPIVVRKKRLGDFVLIGNRFLEIFGQNDIYLFSSFAEQLGHAIINSQYYQWSFKDSLTGLYVRRQLDEKFSQLVEEYQLKKRTFSLMLIDFDFSSRLTMNSVTARVIRFCATFRRFSSHSCAIRIFRFDMAVKSLRCCCPMHRPSLPRRWPTGFLKTLRSIHSARGGLTRFHRESQNTAAKYS
jgi:hypothetical protein